MKMRLLFTFCLAFALASDLPAQTRTWTSKDGTAAMEGRFFKSDDKTVTIILANGRSQVIDLQFLSEADLAWIKENSAKSSAADAASPGDGAPASAKIPAALKGNVMDAKGNDVPIVAENGTAPKYYLFYYSASWCGPCQAFTPDLIRFYKRMKASNPAFETVLVSSDRSLDDEKAYMKEHKMPWIGLKWNDRGYDRAIPGNPSGGIPSMLLVDADGNRLLEVSKSLSRAEFLDQAKDILSGKGEKTASN